MTPVRTFVSIAVLSSAAMATLAWAATDDKHDGHHPAAASTTTTTTQVAQAQPASPGMAMPTGASKTGAADQMKAMHQMHEKMMAAKTPEERNALMAEHMKLMQSGMAMMGGMGDGKGGGMAGMGGGAAAGKPADMAARQGMMEQRMDMMQSMMQMMMDRMPPAPAAK